MIAEAAQRYGIFIRDGTQHVTFDAQDPTSTGDVAVQGVAGRLWLGCHEWWRSKPAARAFVDHS